MNQRQEISQSGDGTQKLEATTTRGIWGQLMSKYSTTGQYPLGMASGFNSTTLQGGADSPIVWCPYAPDTSSEPPKDPLPQDSPDLIFDANVMEAIAHSRPNMMSVKQATICHDNLQEDYKMTARPRGYCLIVNNVDFELDLFPTRRGSDQDANRFDQLFKQLGFDTIMTRNLTADQMRSKFQELASACRPEHDALFVFILSHGSEYGIYGTDGFEVYLESEIISCFDNRNCKALIGKPKVFVIQACRGNSADFGGDTTDSKATIPSESNQMPPPPLMFRENNRVPSSWLPSNRLASEKDNNKHPIRTDMLLVFSCLAGFVSVRNETAGSWLGVALAYFIMAHAHERDLLKILNLVACDITQRVSSNGHIQSIELKLLGWKKNLYFNPGIVR